MGRIFYETLGRITWAVGKHKVKRAITPTRSRRNFFAVVGVAAVAAVIGGAILARTNAPRT
ncbi:MAG: hypothetical protein ACPHCI_08945 [Solirubrobacterales bacterium]